MYHWDHCFSLNIVVQQPAIPAIHKNVIEEKCVSASSKDDFFSLFRFGISVLFTLVLVFTISASFFSSLFYSR